MHKLKFFFYGSLMDYPPSSRRVVRKVNATIQGHIYIFNVMFPGLVIGDESCEDTVKGKLVEYVFPTASELEWFVQDLERWEGIRDTADTSDYFRVTAKVLTEQGTWEEAETFVLNPTGPYVETHVKWTAMENGDYITWRKNQWRK